jgi:hypothetical protein
MWPNALAPSLAVVLGDPSTALPGVGWRARRSLSDAASNFAVDFVSGVQRSA